MTDKAQSIKVGEYRITKEVDGSFTFEIRNVEWLSKKDIAAKHAKEQEVTAEMESQPKFLVVEPSDKDLGSLKTTLGRTIHDLMRAAEDQANSEKGASVSPLSKDDRILGDFLLSKGENFMNRHLRLIAGEDVEIPSFAKGL